MIDPPNSPPHPQLAPRLKKIQDITDADIESALATLRGISPECLTLLRRIFSIDPGPRPGLAQIMADPWFRQFLPDLSRLAVTAPKDTQSVEEVACILQVGWRARGGWVGEGWWVR